MALYAATTGIVGTGKRMKGYVRSVYGAASPEYGLISGLKFTVVKSGD